jgi:hypothetical protein
VDLEIDKARRRHPACDDMTCPDAGTKPSVSELCSGETMPARGCVGVHGSAVSDTGASHNMFSSAQHVAFRQERQPRESERVVQQADGARMRVGASGRCVCDGVDLGDALVPEGLVENLVSPGQFCDVAPAEREVVFRADACEFKHGGEVVLSGDREHGGQWIVPLGCACAESKTPVPTVATTRPVPAARVLTRAQGRAQRRERTQRGAGIDDATSAWPTLAEAARGDAAGGARGRKTATHAQRKVRRQQHERREQQMRDEQSRQQRAQRQLDVAREQAAREEAMALHCRLGHLNLKAVRRLVKDGKEVVSAECAAWLAARSKFGCLHCAIGKTVKKPLPSSKRQARKKKPKQSERERLRGLKKLRKKRVKEVRVGMDLCGPHTPAAGLHAGAKYALLLRKKDTRFSWLRFLKKKNAEAVRAMLEVLLPLVLATLKKNQRLVILTDLGNEWVSESVENLLSSLGIEHKYTSRDSSLRNGIVERHFRTLEQDVATAESQSGLSARWWAELMETAHHERLHLPCEGLPDNRSPYEEETGRDSSPFRAQLHPVGCLAVGRRVVRTSMGARGEELVYLGPQAGTKDGHRLLDLNTRRVIRDRSVVFFGDAEFPAKHSKSMRRERHEERLLALDALGLLEEVNDLSDERTPGGDGVGPRKRLSDFIADGQGADSDGDSDGEGQRRRPVRARAPPERFQTSGAYDQRMYQYAARGLLGARMAKGLSLVALSGPEGEVPEDPTDFREAMRYPHWRAAYERELQKLWANGTFDWEKAPTGAKVLGNQVVWKTKRDEDNKVKEHKARVVARGDGQKEGDGTFSETFSPTVRMDTVRMLFALAAERGWGLRQADVDSAFLIPTLDDDEVIYMRPPPGVKPPEGKEGCVLRLRKSLYGIKQAPRKWNKEMCELLESAGYERSLDPCLFLKFSESRELLSAVLFHVDDVLCAAPEAEREAFVQILGARFPIKDLGEPKHFLGIKVTKLPGGGFAWSQEAYLDRVLEKFNMVGARARRTPISSRLYREEGAPLADATRYRSLVGALMYLMVCTRPDICFAVNQLTRHFQLPQAHHWEAALRVLAYLKATKRLGLSFPGGYGEETMRAYFKGVRELTDSEGVSAGLIGWSDADWAGDEQDRKSTSGYLVQMESGAILSYGCRKQSITADSSAVAELIALDLVSKEVLWQKKLYEQLFQRSAGTVPIMEDNQAAKTLAESHKFSQKVKHLATRYFACREKVDHKDISVDWVRSSEQLADIFTKPLGEQIFCPLRAKLGMVEVAM